MKTPKKDTTTHTVAQNTPELLEVVRVAANIQHETSESRGEIDCTNKTPCIFCQAIAKAGVKS